MFKFKWFFSITFLLSLTASTSWAESNAQIAPAFSLPEIYTGESKTLEEYKGKVVYLDFWASWCGPCRQSMPLLNELRNELGSEFFEVIAINLDKDPEDGKRFLQKYPVNYPVLTDTTGSTPTKYQLSGMPTSYLIDQKGEIQGVHQGFRSSDIDKIRKAVHTLMKQGDES